MDFEASLRLRVSFTTTYKFLDLAAKPLEENPDASQDCVRFHALEQSGRWMAFELQHKIENQEKDMTGQVKGEKTEGNSYQDRNMNGRFASMDLRPLRHRDYRLLYIGQAVSLLGTMITYVALPYQMYRLTGSSLAVGLLGLAGLVPLLAAAFIGGALADAVALIAATMGSAWLIYVVAANHTATILAMGSTNASEGMSGFPLAINLNANFASNQKTGKLKAVASFVKRGRTVSIVRTRVLGENDKLIAEVSTNHVAAK